jgi:DNA-directed RNA polymerase subunit omega
MARITVEDCLDHIHNRFALVLIAAKRTKELLKNYPTLIDDDRENKQVVTSLREVAAGCIKADLTDYNENDLLTTEAGPLFVHRSENEDEDLPPESL